MSEKQAREWGLRQYRGPIWEIINALSLSLVGLDLAMMFHPINMLKILLLNSLPKFQNI